MILQEEVRNLKAGYSAMAQVVEGLRMQVCGSAGSQGDVGDRKSVV